MAPLAHASCVAALSPRAKHMVTVSTTALTSGAHGLACTHCSQTAAKAETRGEQFSKLCAAHHRVVAGCPLRRLIDEAGNSPRQRWLSWQKARVLMARLHGSPWAAENKKPLHASGPACAEAKKDVVCQQR
jgi:hypothetical protein